MSTDEQPVLVVEHLSKTYARKGSRGGARQHVAVRDFSCVLQPGGSIGIVGESGAGKSTIARCLVGLERPTGGVIRLAGEDLGDRTGRRDLRRRAGIIQIVAQNPRSAFDPRMTIVQTLAEMLALHTELDRAGRAERARELLAQVALDERHLGAYPAELSGGQLQRVAIARALAAEPRVLVLDEYVSALDVSVQARVLNLLDDVQARTGVATIVVTHDLAVVRHAAEHTYVMRGGVVVEHGPTAQVLDDPQDAYTQQLKAAVPTPGWAPPGAAIAPEPPTDESTSRRSAGARQGS